MCELHCSTVQALATKRTQHDIDKNEMNAEEPQVAAVAVAWVEVARVAQEVDMIVMMEYSVRPKVRLEAKAG